jgi:hypothetical protein
LTEEFFVTPILDIDKRHEDERRSSTSLWDRQELSEGADVEPEIEEPEPSRLDRSVRERLILLSRKYTEGAFSTEEASRLEIVTSRLRQLLPRSTSPDFERLLEIVEEVDEIRRRDHELLERLP